MDGDAAGLSLCALMHEALGTAVQGTVRFSFSQFTTTADVLAAADALKALARS